MLSVLCLLVIVLGFGLGQDEVFEFNQFQFFYHEDYNLLLTMDDKNCYFTTADGMPVEMLLHLYKPAVELFVLNSIQYKQNLHSSSLDEMRDLYQDRLADYHCLDKTVYRLNISLSNILAYPENAGPPYRFMWNRFHPVVAHTTSS